MDRRHFTTGLAAGAVSTLMGESFAQSVPYSQAGEDQEEDRLRLLTRLDLGPLRRLVPDLPAILQPPSVARIRGGPVLVEVPQLSNTGYVIDLARDLVTQEVEIYPEISPDNPDLQFGGNVRLSGDLGIVLRRTRTTVSIADGSSLVIGGLIHDLPRRGVEAEVNVPILGELPVIGHFFFRNDQAARRRNLIIFITPQIVRQGEE